MQNKFSYCHVNVNQKFWQFLTDMFVTCDCYFMWWISIFFSLSRFWEVCSTGVLRSCEKLHGLFLMKSTIWEIQVSYMYNFSFLENFFFPQNNFFFFWRIKSLFSLLKSVIFVHKSFRICFLLNVYKEVIVCRSLHFLCQDKSRFEGILYTPFI